MSNPDRSNNSIRLAPASPPDSIILRGKSRPVSPWWHDDRYLSVPPGILSALIGCLGTEFVSPKAKLLYWTVIAISFLPMFLCQPVIRKFIKHDYEMNMRWMVAGLIAGSIVFMPLIITPQCGWNDDKCVTINHVRHRVK